MNKKKWINLALTFALVFGFTAVTFAVVTHTAYADFGTTADIGNGQPNATNSPIQNLGSWVAGQLKYLYALLVAVVSIMFVVKHEYSKLVSFLVISIIVAIPIFAPDALPQIAKAIATALGSKAT